MNNLVLFEQKQVRRAWNEADQKWYFAIIDVVGVLADSVDAGAYWRKLKERLKKEGNETVTDCHALKMTTADGKGHMHMIARYLLSLWLVGVFAIVGCDKENKGASSHPMAAPAIAPSSAKSNETDGLRFQLCVQKARIRQGDRLRLGLNVTYQTPDDVTKYVVDCFEVHQFDLQIFGETGKTILPTVVRPGFETMGPNPIFMTGLGSISSYIHIYGNETDGRTVNGKFVRYGLHTIDLLSKAWDLAPGKYKLQATVRLPANQPVTRPAEDGKPVRNWAGSVTTPMMEIEVLPRQ
jgi:hypothetical protein